MKNNKIASSGTKQGLEKLLNEFFYSTTFRIEGTEVFNKNGKVNTVIVAEKKGRFIASYNK